MSSTILTYSSSFNSLSKLDGEVTLQTPIRFNNRQKQAIRLIKVTFSSLIPNIYQIPGSFNNGLIRVSKDGGVNWTNIQLPNGVYEVAHIQGAIIQAISTWWIDASDPGILLRYNLATQIMYFEMDSTKLAVPGQLGIDMSVSQIAELLGYTGANRTCVIDGLFSADSYAKVDWAGNTVSVILEGFGPISIRNGAQSNELCTVPLSSSKNVNEYLYPVSGIVTPLVPLSRFIEEVRTYYVKFHGSRVDSNGVQYPIYVLEGSVELQFELRWS